jgi:hypothetical protein
MSVTTAQDTIAGIDEKYRTCLDTGLKVYTKAETLIKVNAVTAVIFLAVGGFFGVLVALTRWPAVHILCISYRPIFSTWCSPRTAPRCCSSGSSFSRWRYSISPRR